MPKIKTASKESASNKKNGQIDINKAITVSWSLAELPSPQHRAGLAGLVMLVEFTRRHTLPENALLEIKHLDEYRLDISLNLVGLNELFDKVYDADREEIEVTRPWSKKQKDGTKKEVTPKRRETKTTVDKKGKTKEIEICIYDTVVPRGGPLSEWTPPDDSGRWIKLWRDWLWNTLRAIPKQRTPYIQRAGSDIAVEDDDTEDDNSEAKDVMTAWQWLNGDTTAKLASTYYLGSMDVNAENVSFQDRGRFLFLLHFWPFAIQLFIPQHLNAKGEREYDGYVTCIPDVARLKSFITRHERALRSRTADAAGFRPRQALIDLPEAAALESERWLETAIKTDLNQDLARPTAGFQIIHAVKEGNSVRIRSNRMITPTRKLQDAYQALPDCWSHLIKHQVLLNLISQKPWWHGFERICATFSKDFTIKDNAFRHDARELFKHFTPEDSPMPDHQSVKTARPLEQIILQMVQAWISGRLESKYDLIWSKVKDSPKQDDYEKKKSKLATEAFLAARSRPGKEFARWFTSTLCSVNQRGISSEVDFVALAQALDENPDHVRSLTLLALSARG
jgi:CRISPR-associated protein Cmx8